MSMNKTILIGRLGENPELKYTPSGSAVCNFSVATQENWTDKQGQKQSSTEWHRIVVWGKLAEISNKYLEKGNEVSLFGRIKTRQWEDQQGIKRYTTEIHADEVNFIGSRTSSSRDTDKNESEKMQGGKKLENKNNSSKTEKYDDVASSSDITASFEDLQF